MTNITKAAKQALAELADWHWSQAATLRKAASTSAMDKPEPGQSSLTRMADWHDAQKSIIRAALQDKAEVHIPAAGPSTFEQRFAEAVRLLTHASPPADMVASWLARTSEDLRHWIGSQKGTPEWAQSLAITDAAHAMASSPVEGEQHDFEPPAAQQKASE